MGEYLVDDLGGIDTTDDLHRALAAGAGLDVDVEYALQALGLRLMAARDSPGVLSSGDICGHKKYISFFAGAR